MSIVNDFEKRLLQLAANLEDAQNSKKQYVQSMIGDGMIIFDVKQNCRPIVKSRKAWDDLTERQQIEATFSRLPDYIMRDRIYVPPQYLNVHFLKLEMNLETFRQRIKSINVDGVCEVHEEQNFVQTQYDLYEGLTRWAHRENIPHVYPGERVLVNVPLELVGERWFFVKLMTNDQFPSSYIAFTFEPKEHPGVFQIALALVRVFESA